VFKTKIIEIEGIGEKYAKTLEKAGISEVENLVPLTWRELKELAGKTKISLKLLEKWQDQAELMEIKGVGPEYSEVLNKVGIDSIRELAYRNPQNTLDMIAEFDKKQPDVIRKIPKVEEITDWISQSKEKYNIKKEKTSPKETPIAEIEGVGSKYSKTLEKAGLASVEDFFSFDSVKIKSLSASTKISEKLLDKWAEHADLMRIGGVGPEYAEVLNEIGVDSVKELAQRNPNNTLERIMKLDQEKPDVFRRPPRLEEIEEWIEEAKKIK
jgi:predicted flap endonuclease-1-like 5' DNA nuclease